ncbi:MAG: alpha/beta hydrolase [bacterium]
MEVNTNHFSIESLVIEQSVEFAALNPAGKIDEETSLLIALHGYGQNCDRFIRLFEPLHYKKILVVAPQAPHQFYVKLIPKVVGFTWLTKYNRDRSIEEFGAYMQKLLGKLSETYPYNRKRVYFLGFSQGVSMAYRFAISGKQQIAGIIACGADLPLDVSEKLTSTSRFPVFLAHGLEDTIVPLEKAKHAQQTLRAAGFRVDHFFFPGGHEIPKDVVEKIGDWIEGR